jgi:hypothetical protein
MNGDALHGPTSIRGRLADLATSFAFPMVAAVVLGVSLVRMLVRPQWGDQTWLFFAARRLLDAGQMHFGDLVEANPPLIVWLSEIPIRLSQTTGIPPTAALQLVMALIIASSVTWTVSLVGRSGGLAGRIFAAWFALALLFAVAIRPWPHYAQREHILLLLVLTYLAMAARRIDKLKFTASEAFLAGMLGATGILLKPHHAGIVGVVELFMLAKHRNIRALVRPETVAMAATAVAYAGAIWLWESDYLRKVLPLTLHTYYGYHRVEFWTLLSPMRALKLAVLLLAWALLYRRLAHRALSAVLVLAAVGATLGCLVQMKGHDYHYVPALAFFDLLLAVIVIDGWLRWFPPRAWAPSTGVTAVIATVTSVATIAVSYPLQRTIAARGYVDERVAAQQSASREIPRGSTVVVLSTSTESIFEQVLDRGWEWGSRFDCLWMVPAIVDAERSAARNGWAEPAAVRDAATTTRNAVTADLERWRPNPVLVDRCQDRSIVPCLGAGGMRIDLLRWLREDPGFASAWEDYVMQGQVGPYDLWCRQGDTEVCRRILAHLQ